MRRALRKGVTVMDQHGVGSFDKDRRMRRGFVAIATVMVLLTLNLIILGFVLSGGRDHDLTVRRLETVEAAYAAEAGVNMSVREMITFTDDDGDGTVGSISDDGDSGNDPAIGNARFIVTMSVDVPVVGQTTVTSAGRSGQAFRTMTAILE